jgi:hypothetical protein
MTLKEFRNRLIFGIIVGVILSGIALYFIGKGLILGKEFVIYSMILVIVLGLIIGMISYHNGKVTYYKHPGKKKNSLPGKTH